MLLLFLVLVLVPVLVLVLVLVLFLVLFLVLVIVIVIVLVLVIVIVVWERASCVCISTTVSACTTVKTNYYPLSCRALRRGPAQPQIPHPTPNPVQRSHEPQHPDATAEPWHHRDDTWDPQPSIFSRNQDETDNSHSHQIL